MKVILCAVEEHYLLMQKILNYLTTVAAFLKTWRKELDVFYNFVQFSVLFIFT